MLKQSYADHLAGEVQRAIEDVYGEVMVARVAHSEELRSDPRWGGAKVMAALGLISEDQFIASRLGVRLRAKGRSEASAGRRDHPEGAIRVTARGGSQSNPQGPRLRLLTADYLGSPHPTLSSGSWTSRAASEELPQLLVVDFERAAEPAYVHVRELGLRAVVQRQRVRAAVPVVDHDMAPLARPFGDPDSQPGESGPEPSVSNRHGVRAACGSPARTTTTGRPLEPAQPAGAEPLAR